MSEYKGAEANESRECSEHLDGEGYVLGYPDASGIVAKCAADAKAYGIAQMSTKHPVTGGSRTGIQVGIVRAPKFANVRYNAGVGEAIALGDIVSMTGANAAGCVTKHASTAHPGTWAAATAETIDDEKATVVGIAQEAKAQSTSGLLKVQLLCPIPIKQ